MLKIKEIRIHNNLSQDDIVTLTGIPKRSYVDYENEKADIQLSKLQKIATALNVTISELLDETKSVKNVVEKNDHINDHKNDHKPNVKKTYANEIFHIGEPNEEYRRVMRRIKFADGVDISEEGAPFYPLPVSAGTVAELMNEEEKPTGYISMPGITCKAYFPVIGFSFGDLIPAGSIIGVDFINSWEVLDPDCVYFIVTHDQRMAKRLMNHPTDNNTLICISPNFREFPISIDDIKAIHKIVFCGRPI